MHQLIWNPRFLEANFFKENLQSTVIQKEPMMESEQQAVPTRWDEIETIWKQNRYLYVVVGFIFGLLAFPAIELILTDLKSFLANLVPEFIGIAVTVLLIDSLLRRREEERAVRELKERLISELSLNTNVFAKRAASILWRRGWLQDGSVRYADLEAANLEGAYLRDADFTDSDLHYANLMGANLRGAKLTRTDLRSTNLAKADLREADLCQARVYSNTVLDEQTIMPDGTHWNAGIIWSNFGVIFVELT